MTIETKHAGDKPPIEIERKFVVRNLPEMISNAEHQDIRQGYLAIDADGSEVRVREKGGRYTITAKSKGDLTRGEYETELTPEQFEDLWPATDGKRVEKTRFKIPYGDYTIELDIYYGELEGLVTAEVEFRSEEAATSFEPPDWLGKDVTSDSSYKNQNLAAKGFPSSPSQA